MAVKAISANVDLLLVVGSENSSNSKRLVEVGDNFGVQFPPGERLPATWMRSG